MQQLLTNGEGAFQATFPPPGDGRTGDALPPQRLRRSERLVRVAQFQTVASVSTMDSERS